MVVDPRNGLACRRRGVGSDAGFCGQGRIDVDRLLSGTLVSRLALDLEGTRMIRKPDMTGHLLSFANLIMLSEKYTGRPMDTRTITEQKLQTS